MRRKERRELSFAELFVVVSATLVMFSYIVPASLEWTAASSAACEAAIGSSGISIPNDLDRPREAASVRCFGYECRRDLDTAAPFHPANLPRFRLI